MAGRPGTTVDHPADIHDAAHCRLCRRLIVAVPVGSSLGWDVCRRCLPMLLPPLECGHRDPYARDHLAGACPWRAAS